VARILFAMTSAEIPDGAIEVFNNSLASAQIDLRLEPLGQNRDLFGDGRDVTMAALFIQQSDRPDVSAATVGAIARGVSKAAAAAQGENQLVGAGVLQRMLRKDQQGRERERKGQGRQRGEQGKGRQETKDEIEGPDGISDKLARKRAQSIGDRERQWRLGSG
jgi:hypothetical protein